MKVLVLAQVLPHPPDSGPKVKTAAVLRHLAARHEVTLAAFTRGDQSADADALRGFLHAVHTVPMRRGTPRDLAALGRSLASGESFLMTRDERPSMRRLVAELDQADAFDLVHVDQINMARYAPLRPGLARVLDAHNALWVLTERLAATMPKGLRRRLLEREVRLLRRYEGRVCREFEGVLAVSEEDAAALRRAAESEADVTVVPIAIDLAATPPIERHAGATRVLHVGSLLWPPTADGLRWFLQEVWPLLRAQRPELALDVAGPSPPADIAAWSGRDVGVNVLGYVNDLGPLLAASAVMVVPLRAGGGMRVRILNGLAHEMPMVTTPIGAEGIDVEDGRHLLVAESPDEFAAATLRLLDDRGLGERLGRAGRRLVEERYDYRAACQAIERVYEDAVRRAGTRIGGQAMSRLDRLDAVALFAVLFLCYTYTFPRWADWNQNSRFDLVVAIVDHHTLSIDCCFANTGDYALYEGHAYSDKAPGLSLLAVPVYFVVSHLLSVPAVEAGIARLAHRDALRDTLRAEGSGLLVEKIRFFVGLVIASAVLVSLPSAAVGVLLYFYLARFSARRAVRLAVTLAYALATIAYPYSGGFWAHQLVAALLFTAFYLVARGPRAERPLEMATLGLLLGYAVISEYPAVLVAAPLAALAAWRVGLRAGLWWAVAGGCLPLLLAAAYNAAIFGTPLPVGYRYSALWQEQHSTGFLSLTYPRLQTLWGLTLSPYRGLFLHCPVLLFSLPGFVLLWREGRHRVEVALSAWAVVSFLLFNSSSSMWWGGFAVGPRYLVPMLPFLAWPSVAVLDRWGGRTTWILFGAAFAASVFAVWGLSLAGQQFPEDHHTVPLLEYAWPRLARGELARNAGMVFGLRGGASLVPLAAGVAGIALAWKAMERRA